MMKLTIELVPQTSWYSNVRSNVSSSDWDIIRHKVYRAAKNRCEICGGIGSKHPVECHEVWEYDDEKHIQRLVRMMALCPHCHQVKHFGRTSAIGKYDDAIKHLCLVNDCGEVEAKRYVQKQLKVWHNRSQYQWTLNIDILNRYMKDDIKGFHNKLMTGRRKDLW